MLEKKQTIYESAQFHVIRQNFPKNAKYLFNRALNLFDKMENNEIINNIMTQMLQSILIMGKLYPIHLDPQTIFGTETEELRTRFSGAFKYDLPKQTPFSYYLELVVLWCGEHNEEEVKRIISDTYNSLKGSSLIPPVICICKSSISGRRYYGATAACGSQIGKSIMIALSCTNVWHELVSSVVMSASGNNRTPRSIKLPDTVTCTAYELRELRMKPPCKRCCDLFSLCRGNTTNNSILHEAGKCAETEAISNFLNAEKNKYFIHFQ